jgi:uncharacterized protein YceH (UPF0502 family)
MTRPDGAFVARLAREPRRKDHAYAHLFGGPIVSAPAEAPLRDVESPDAAAEAPPRGGLAALEARVALLEQALADVKKQLGID